MYIVGIDIAKRFHEAAVIDRNDTIDASVAVFDAEIARLMAGFEILPSAFFIRRNAPKGKTI